MSVRVYGGGGGGGLLSLSLTVNTVCVHTVGFYQHPMKLMFVRVLGGGGGGCVLCHSLTATCVYTVNFFNIPCRSVMSARVLGVLPVSMSPC